MITPTIEKIEAPPLDVAIVKWPITQVIDIDTAYDDSYKFWHEFDKQLLAVQNSKDKSNQPSYGGFKKSLIGMVGYNQEGNPYCAESEGDLEKYSSFGKFRDDVSRVCDISEVLLGFCIGFHHFDVSFALASLRRMNDTKLFEGFAEFSVWSHYNIKDKIAEFIRTTNPDCDTSVLEQLSLYKLLPMPEILRG